VIKTSQLGQAWLGQSQVAGYGVEADGSHSYTGSGTLTFSGAASLAKTKAYTGTGTLTFSGSAVTASGLTVRRSAWLGKAWSGSAQLSGFDIGPGAHSYTGSGTLTFSGAAALAKTKAYTGSGTLTFSGAAATSISGTHSYTGSGALNFSGTAPVAKTKAYTGSGTIEFLGAAETQNIWSGIDGGLFRKLPVPALGTLTRQGTPYALLHKLPVPVVGNTGPAALRSPLVRQPVPQAHIQQDRTPVASLTLHALPTATIQRLEVIRRGIVVKHYTAHPRPIVFSGTAPHSRTWAYLGAGTLTFSGRAITEQRTATIKSYVGSGRIEFTGGATVNSTRVVIGSGGMTFGGSAPHSRTRVYTGSGRITFSGAAATLKTKKRGNKP
jgi:hypothetical protein